jgi:hypothetical protein
MPINDLIKQLPKLTQSELKLLRLAIDELSVRKDDEGESYLYSALLKATGSRTPYSLFMKTTAYPHWRRHLPDIERFIATNFPSANRITGLALATFTLQALCQDLKRRNVPISMGSVAKNLGRFADVFEDQFPGYLSSGLGPLILTMLKEHRDDVIK